MAMRHLAGAWVAIAVAFVCAPAMAADIVTSIVLDGAFDTLDNPVAVSPSALPVDKPLSLHFTVYGKAGNLGPRTGLGLYLLDVGGIDAGLASIAGATEFPLYDPPGPTAAQSVWEAAMDENNDLKSVIGFIFPRNAAGTFRQNLGAGSAADNGTYGVPLFAFILQSKQVPGSMTLSLGKVAGQDAFGYLGVDDLAQPAVMSSPTDSATYGTLDLAFVPEPTTLCLLGLGGLALLRRRMR